MHETIHTTEEEQPAVLQVAQRTESSMVAPLSESGTEGKTESDRIEEHASALVAMLQKEAAYRKRQSVGVMTISTALMIGIVQMVPRLADSDAAAFGAKAAMCLAMLFGIGGVMTADLTRRSYRSKKYLKNHIAGASTKKNVAVLIRALKVDGKEVKNIAKAGLIEILPQLNAGDAGLLGQEEREILIRILSVSPYDRGYRDLTELWSAAAMRREIALRVAILKAYEQVGGAKELALVERIANELPIVLPFARKLKAVRVINKMPAEIVVAAAECLPYLQIRSNEEVASRQLLRASSPDMAGNRTLLRAAATEQELRPDHLLRAADTQ